MLLEVGRYWDREVFIECILVKRDEVLNIVLGYGGDRK